MRVAGGTWMIGIAAMAMAVLGCGSDDDSGAVSATSITSPSTAPSGTAESDVTSPGDGATTSTSSSTTVGTSVPSPGDEEPTLHAAGPSGSGCSPGGSELPDGWWFGERATPIGDDVGFDLACYYIDAAADAEAAARGDEAIGGFYIVNDNPTIRTVPVSPTATTQCLTIDGVLEGCDMARVNDGFRSIWIQVADGAVVRVIEQLLP